MTAMAVSAGGLHTSGGVAVGDGTWNLAVFVTDLQVERTLRVRGDTHVGGLMIRLVDELGKNREQCDLHILWENREKIVENLNYPQITVGKQTKIHASS